ncbi:MAG: DUF1599 domain-containing protein [Clostridiales bacterium]|nr:DUF1599 domain-containing protein [Clostridiales bacterium]
MLEKQFDGIREKCEELFSKKLHDYGATWLLFRDSSLIDQMWIKIKRIRVLEENGDISLVGESRTDEFVGILNYAAIMLMLKEFPVDFPNKDDILENTSLLEKLDFERTIELFDKIFDNAKQLMIKKNHDYGDAWKSMQISSITDMIVIKLSRVKNILKNNGKLLASENINAQLYDVINYCVFALIKMEYV